MADKRTYTAKINAKGLDGTGLTEDQAKGLCLNQGRHLLMLIEVHSADKNVREDGSQQVSLLIDTAEPIPAHLEDMVRELQRALYLQRPEQVGQATLQGATPGGPTVDQAAETLAAQLERDDDGKVTGIWEGKTTKAKTNRKRAAAPTTDAEGDQPGTGASTGASDAPDSATADEAVCPTPGCTLGDGHEGDHNDTGWSNEHTPTP